VISVVDAVALALGLSVVVGVFCLFLGKKLS
jgi:hypothetical protein